MSESLIKLKEMTQRLSDETGVLKSVAEFSTDGFWDWHLQEDYEYMSPRFWEILGYDPSTKKHKPSEWQKIIHPEDLKKALKIFDKHVTSKGVEKYRLVVRYKCGKSGGWIKLICRGKVIKWDGLKPLRMVGTHTLLEGLDE